MEYSFLTSNRHSWIAYSLPLITSHTLILHCSFSKLYYLISLVFSSISNALTGSNHLTLSHLHLLNQTSQTFTDPQDRASVFLFSETAIFACFTLDASFWIPVTGSWAALHLKVVARDLTMHRSVSLHPPWRSFCHSKRNLHHLWLPQQKRPGHLYE